jgi:hypothetical protein
MVKELTPKWKHFKVKFKCEHMDSMPGFTLERAKDAAEHELCDKCADKKHEDEMKAHYAWMAAYRKRKQAEKEKEKEAAKKAKKVVSKKKTGKKSGKSPGLKTQK